MVKLAESKTERLLPIAVFVLLSVVSLCYSAKDPAGAGFSPLSPVTALAGLPGSDVDTSGGFDDEKVHAPGSTPTTLSRPAQITASGRTTPLLVRYFPTAPARAPPGF